MNTGVGCHSLLQGIFLTQGLNLGLLHCRKILHRLSHQGSLHMCMYIWASMHILCLLHAAAAAKSLQSCPTLRPHRWQPTRLPCPWDSPGKNTGVGCHFLLQRMKVKSESEVTQSCLTLSDPMDCSLPGSTVHGIFQARILEWGAISSSRGSSQPKDRTCISYISALAGGFFTSSTTWEAHSLSGGKAFQL